VPGKSNNPHQSTSSDTCGFLSASFVPVVNPAGITTLWTWESERTVWLNRPFAARHRLQTIEEEPRAGNPRYVLRLASAQPADSRDRGWLTPR
jgi:hypothetical protein